MIWLPGLWRPGMAGTCMFVSDTYQALIWERCRMTAGGKHIHIFFYNVWTKPAAWSVWGHPQEMRNKERQRLTSPSKAAGETLADDRQCGGRRRLGALSPVLEAGCHGYPHLLARMERRGQRCNWGALWGAGWSRIERAAANWSLRTCSILLVAVVGWLACYQAEVWISCSLGVQRDITEISLQYFSVWVQNLARLGFEAAGSALQSWGRCRASIYNEIGKAGVQVCMHMCSAMLLILGCVGVFFLFFFSLLRNLVVELCSRFPSIWFHQSALGQIQLILIRVKALCLPVSVYLFLCCSHVAISILFQSTVFLKQWMPVWRIINCNYSPVCWSSSNEL